jgi:hypothetical protein
VEIAQGHHEQIDQYVGGIAGRCFDKPKAFANVMVPPDNIIVVAASALQCIADLGPCQTRRPIP